MLMFIALRSTLTFKCLLGNSEFHKRERDPIVYLLSKPTNKRKDYTLKSGLKAMLDIYDEWNLGDSMCCQQLQFEIIWGPLQKQGVKREEGGKKCNGHLRKTRQQLKMNWLRLPGKWVVSTISANVLVFTHLLHPGHSLWPLSHW